jgi:hypothetical protein
MLRLSEIEHELATETSQESQEHILHSAASILRHDIQSFVINNEDYPNVNQTRDATVQPTLDGKG